MAIASAVAVVIEELGPARPGQAMGESPYASRRTAVRYRHAYESQMGVVLAGIECKWLHAHPQQGEFTLEPYQAAWVDQMQTCPSPNERCPREIPDCFSAKVLATDGAAPDQPASQPPTHLPLSH